MKKNLIITILVSLLYSSCEKSTQESLVENSNRANGVISGDDWTFSRFSDSLDENISIEEVKSIFGNDPYVNNDGDFTELGYEVVTPDQFQNGVRITTIKFIFEGDALLDVRIGFTAFFD